MANAMLPPMPGYPEEHKGELLGPPRLPAGRHGLPREFVAHNQRERLIAGLAEAVAERGYAETTVAQVAAKAAVSKRTFYEHFGNKEECFLVAFDVVLGQLMERVLNAYLSEDHWPLQVRAALTALLRFLASEPELARLGMVESLAAGPATAQRYQEAVQSFIPFFRDGRRDDFSASMPETTEEAVVGGLASLIARRVYAGQAEDLEALLPDVLEFALTPYVGPSEAARVSDLPAGS